MRTWVVLAAVLAVAASAAADALRGGLRDNDARTVQPAAERRIVPPGVPAGFMGTVFYSDPRDDCRLHSLRLAGFRSAQAPIYTGCRFSLSPDGKTAAPEGSVWRPHADVVAVPGRKRFTLQAESGQRPVSPGSSPAYRPDGTLTYVRNGELVVWDPACANGASRCRRIFPRPVTTAAWFSDSRFAAILPQGKLVIVEDGRVLVRADLPAFRTAALELSPKRTFATLWLDGGLAGTFDAGGGPVPIAPVGAVTSLAWAPSERWVVAATRAGAVFLLRPDTGDARVRRLDISARDLAWR